MGIVEGSGLFSAIQNTHGYFTITTKSKKVEVAIKNPYGNDIDCRITQNLELHEVFYVASECGEHLVTIRCDQKEIPGSPFKLCVINPFKVRLISEVPRPKILSLFTSRQKEIVFDTTSAGPGNCFILFKYP